MDCWYLGMIVIVVLRMNKGKGRFQDPAGVMPDILAAVAKRWMLIPQFLCWTSSVLRKSRWIG